MKIPLTFWCVYSIHTCNLVKNSQGESVCPKDGMILIQVPAGLYRFGNHQGNYSEQPEFVEQLNSFMMDKTEVSQGQFRRFCQTTGYIAQGRWDRGQDKDELPVTMVSWDDANNYARWVDRRLPTELEYEAAARSSKISLLQCRAYEPVATFMVLDQNPLGIINLLGNVSEWSRDWHDRYRYQNARDRKSGPEDHALPEARFVDAQMVAGNERSTRKTVRGGSFGCLNERSLSPTLRNAQFHEDWYGDVGFRLVMDEQP